MVIHRNLEGKFIDAPLNNSFFSYLMNLAINAYMNVTKEVLNMKIITVQAAKPYFMT